MNPDNTSKGLNYQPFDSAGNKYGELRPGESAPLPGITSNTDTCPRCNGTKLWGFTHGQHMPCPYCQGTGHVPATPAPDTQPTGILKLPEAEAQALYEQAAIESGKKQQELIDRYEAQHTQPGDDRTLDEQVEDLFTLRISSSGAMIDVGLPGDDSHITVDCEVFSALRKSIEALIARERQATYTQGRRDGAKELAELAVSELGGHDHSKAECAGCKIAMVLATLQEKPKDER